MMADSGPVSTPLPVSCELMMFQYAWISYYCISAFINLQSAVPAEAYTL